MHARPRKLSESFESKNGPMTSLRLQDAQQERAHSPLPFSPRLLMGILAWVLLWAGVRTLAEANLDPYGDMLESWVWGQTWSWGTYKHPPLMNWVTHLWFMVWPTTTGAYKLLAYVVVAVGLLGILELARLHGLRRWLWPILVITVCGLPESTLSAKYNANTILLAAWPWVAVVWTQVYVLRKPSLWWAVGLGAVSAMAMLGKYYTGVLLLGLFLSSLLTPEGRRWYLSRTPWVAFLTFVVCLIPHAQWQMSHQWASVAYVGEQGDGHVAWKELWHFTLSPLIYWGLAWLVTAMLLSPATFQQRGLLRRMLLCWQHRGWNDTLFWLAFMPWFITLVFGITGFVKLSLPWAIPIGYAYPLLWVRNLSVQLPLDATGFSRRASRVHVGLLMGLLVSGPLLAHHYVATQTPSYFLPREEAAKVILSSWREQHPDVPLHWVAGQWSESGFLAFYGNHQLFTMPGTPDDPRAQVTPHTGWQHEGGLLICRGGWQAANVTEVQQISLSERQAYLSTPCAVQVGNWLSHHGRTAEPRLMLVKREGFAFPDAPVYVYLVYEYLP
ncbi:MAG: glycosyl transferase [Burkholderiales bacterium]|nr:MAG: glycosyl transferase [Burkholderiales bacterium]